MDEAWLTSLVSERKPERSSHRRGASLLQPINDSILPSSEAITLNPNSRKDARSIRGPPKATLLARAISWHTLRQAAADIRRPSIDTRRPSLESQDLFRTVQSVDTQGIGNEADLLWASHEEYEQYYDQLQLSQNQLDSLLANTQSSLNLLSTLSQSFKVVEEQTHTFHEQCQTIISEQRRMTQLADDMKENLQYYSFLEPITRRLNAPGATSVVTRQEFPELLSNLDSCLDYMQAHPKQREAATYQARYKLLLTRGLTLIRVHFTESLRALAHEVSRRIADKQLNEATQSALLYAKFRAAAPELRDLGLEILKRAVPSAYAEKEGEAEYQSLMNELYGSYTATRGRLILPIIVKQLAELSAVDSSVRDLVAFARSAINFIRGICLDEYELWHEWFVIDGGVYEFLEAMCEPLFDHLRPRTIHETKLSKLCELCTFLQAGFGDSEDEDDDLGQPQYGNGTQGRKLNFAALIQPALADAQTRLVFLAMAVLRNDIESYRPKPEDLDYPKNATRRSSVGTNGKQPVLSGRKNPARNGEHTAAIKSPTIVDQDDGDLNDTYLAVALDKSMDWYPTLPKAIRLLSRIYRLVNSTVFDDLAHRIVHSTTLSLVAASSQIATKVSPTDANLFLISHLLRLKHQIVAFDIEFVAPEISFDFSRLFDTFYELRDRGGLWNPGTWYRLAAGGLLPRVVENMLDAKEELDGQLRVVINEFVSSFSDRITAPLKEVVKGKDQDGLDPKRAASAVRGLAEKDVLFARRKLKEYLEDARTRETLVAAIKDQVVLAYEDWVDLQQQQQQEEGGKKVASKASGRPSRKGKSREDEIWSSDVFAEWCDGAFGAAARRGSGGGGDDGNVGNDSEDGM